MAEKPSEESMYPTDQPLFDEFPAVSTEAWEEKIAKDLKGADYKEKLAWHTDSSFEVLPFYRREALDEINHLPSEAAEFPFLRGKKVSDNDWEIRQDIYAQSIDEANEQAREATKRGAEGLTFHLRVRAGEDGDGHHLHGIPIQSQDDFNALLDGVDLTQTAVHFDAGIVSSALAAMWSNYLDDHNLDPNDTTVSFLCDPVAHRAAHGSMHKVKRKWLDELKTLIEQSAQRSKRERVLLVNTRLYHNAGATAAQELAFAVALANDYFAHLIDKKTDPEAILNSLQFSMGIGSSYFIEIAKFRALRLLWARVSGHYEGVDDNSTSAYIHAQTANWNKTLYDAHNNMLRTTTEAMSAAIGGCDAITVDPYDAIFRMPDEYSRRIARNSQIILKAEAYLDKVVDPAGGSYYIEELTQKMAAKAWEYIQDIEEAGGFMAALDKGVIHAYLHESQKKKDWAIATRDRVFVGTNQYPNAEDQMLNQLDEPTISATLKSSEYHADIPEESYFESLSGAFSEGALLGDVISELFMIGKHVDEPIRPYRGAQPFEHLRLQTEQFAEQGNDRPTVHMIPIGHKKMRKARATFASNFFGCVGYDIEEPIGYEDIDKAVKAIREVQPEVIVLCSSDQEYELLVPKLSERLNHLDADSKPLFVLAGSPGDHEEEWQSAGVTSFIHRGMNALETLRDFHTALGITSSSDSE
jgi:methylmalonyl-CoA mutase